jgi:predicted nuclease with RNAse H fold
MGMLTLGVDLAAQAADTAVCRVLWAETATVDIPPGAADDAFLAELIEEADRVGIDVPLGWPSPFVRALWDYHNGLPWTGGHGNAMQLRRTDLFVRDTPVRGKPGKRPLSVSADKIAVTAMRAANLFSSMEAGLDRTGRGKVVEVYPAAALRCWGFNSQGYKGKAGRVAREQSIESFAHRTRRWLGLTPKIREMCVESDHIFDALISALVARAAHLGQVHPMGEEHVEVARVEGWIALPLEDSLEQLA